MPKFSWVPETAQPHSSPIGKILVFGATGNLGFTVCECLATFKIPFVAAYKAGTRNRDNIDALRKLQNNVGSHVMSIIEVDWARPDTIKNALQGIERVFLKFPIGSIDECALTFANYCVPGNNTLRYICYLSYMDAKGPLVAADPNQPQILMEEIPKHKLGIAAYWGEQRIKSIKDISYSIVRPSFLFSTLQFDVPNIKSRGEICRPLKDCSVNIVSDTDVAQAVCSLLTRPDFKHTGDVYHLTGSGLHKLNNVATLLSEELGKPIKYVDVTEDEYRRMLADCGLDREGLDCFVSSHTFMKQGGYDWTFDDINKLIGIKPRPLRDMIRDNIDLFK